ncbi:MAG TPA: cytochrome c3 family protein [Desulfobacteraceae bacterium]|nr:cytochrome c3 family protein [Desulfobacteraceae bacterium]
MQRSVIFAFCFAVIFISGNAFTSETETPDTINLPTGTMLLTAPSTHQAKRTPVAFSHSLHFSQPCNACHHEWEGLSQVKGCDTSGCHDQFWPAPPGEDDVNRERTMSMTGAYHKACRGCHYEQSQAIEEGGTSGETMPLATGPVDCQGCHPANSPEGQSSPGSIDIPLGAMTIHAPEDVWQKRASVSFPHDDHFNYSCKSCHHAWDGTSEIQNCTTSQCHDQTEPHPDTRDINDPKNNDYFLAAYHKACIECHRDLQEKAETMTETAGTEKADLPPYGPVLCSGCHNM